MSHLGDRISALVDGELSPADRDRAHAHLAGCAACRAEANQLRALKKRMRGLGEVAPDDTLTQRLIALAEPGPPVPARRRARQTFGPAPRPRRRYLALGVASCVFAGLGVTAFTMGGDQQTPGPRITPQVQLYSVQHAITTGQVPSGGSSAVPAPEFSSSAPLP